MKLKSYMAHLFRHLESMLVFVFCTVVACVVQVHAGTIEIPAWAFDRGNAVIHADPAEYADAGPVVASGKREPWGWRVEYDVEYPVEGMYSLKIQYASAEARPVEVFFDTRNISKCCTSVSLDPKTGEPTWKSSGARWDDVLSLFGSPGNIAIDRRNKGKAGKHTIMVVSQTPLPHLVSLRLTTPEPFPDSWQPPEYRPGDLSDVPKKYHKLFEPSKKADVAALREPVKNPPRPKFGGSLRIPAWTFDRGNVEIYTDPSKYANAGPLAGGPEPADEGVVEYDIDFPVAGEYILSFLYASAESRPVDVILDGKNLGKACSRIAFGSAPFELPVRLAADSWAAKKMREEVFATREGAPIKLSVTQGKHTLKLARRGPLPNLMELKLDSLAAFPKGWKQPGRDMPHLDRVRPEHRTHFLPANAVNTGALRLAIEDTIKTYGQGYAGEEYLKKLAGLEKQQQTAAGAETNEQHKVDVALKSFRREVMLAHPGLKFDKLLFLKRPGGGYGHTYTDQGASGTNGNLCVLSPVSADGKVTELVPELKGGLFDRFDLSYDAKKVVFGYKKPSEKGQKGRTFRIYEIDIDPEKGKMKPGSLRQLTFGSDHEDEVVRTCQRKRRDAERGFDDMDPIYLPNGKIMFTSTRAMRNVFCAAATSTILYVMDADGKNMRCLSEGPINETSPSVMDDGRVIYTRWEYVDKGLGNGQGLWVVRPDGSGSDHIFKNLTARPAGMGNARSIPGSRSLVVTGGAHHSSAVGAVILVDTRRTRRGMAPMTCITPEVGYACMGHVTYNFGMFMDPYPFSEKFFLVSHMLGPRDHKRKYGIYALDAWGNRAEICSDPKMSCYEPFPLMPRRMPVQVAPVEPLNEKVARGHAESEEETGFFFVQNVYEGMTGIEKGRVKYLRVMGALPWPWGEHGMNQIGLNVDVHRKKVYGVVKVHEDGSAYFKVPANENLFFQALDENYLMLQHMPTFVNLMPGENRGCIGCHEHRRKAPSLATGRPKAMEHPVQVLTPQPGETGPRVVHYDTDVQTILDKHCISCHSGGDAKSRLVLTGEPTEQWSRSYENLIGRNLVSYMDCRYGRAHFRPEPPLTFGSSISKLVAQIQKDPCKGKLSREECIRITTWIDANCPFYGTYKGKRDLKYKGEPDFRTPPLVMNK